MTDVTLTPSPLPADALCRRCDPARFPFRTTDELDDLAEALGQKRAVGAIEFGIGIGRDGYNLFAMGPEGTGRRTVVRRYLEQQAGRQETPSDWCYVFNFETPHKPRALRFPAGRAAAFRLVMEHLVDDLRAGIPAAFESDEYRARSHEIEAEFEERREHAIEAIGERAKEQGVALVRTPSGFGFAPRDGDSVMNPEDFRKLPEAEQQRLEKAITALQEELEAAIHEMPKWRREAQRKLRDLNRQVTNTAVNGLIEEVKSEFGGIAGVADYLDRVREDVLDRAEVFRQTKEGEPQTMFGIPIAVPEAGDYFLRRYKVNVLIDHSGAAGAPIVDEANPTHDNLVGRIEHISQMGALVTDFTLIKSGSLHRANGGYLVIDALKLLSQPFAWDGLKRALRAREIRTEPLGQALSLISTVSLEPEPIPLDVKVVLVGQRQIYYLLHAYDPEFTELFKVVVDFEEDTDRTPESDLLFARLVATVARRQKLMAFDRGAVARCIDFAARAAGDAGKLSLHARDLADLLREANYWATRASRNSVTAEDVERAVTARIERASRVRDRVHEGIQRGTLLIDTSGVRAGQVNGLSVMQLGDHAFGTPHRITARVRPGGGKVVDIEREVALGGPIHSKGVLILSGFLAGRYAVTRPLSLAASIVFEQSYGGVEGDSASSAELYALLSALADVPIRQSLAVTGSVNQHGDVQAIGGVNEKVEGFFDVCRERGLTGAQGVLIPASNVKNLMLRRDVVDAVAGGQFSIWPVTTIDQGIEILTGAAAGVRDAMGHYPADSINGRVERRIAEYADRLRDPGAAAKGRRRRIGSRR